MFWGNAQQRAMTRLSYPNYDSLHALRRNTRVECKFELGVKVCLETPCLQFIRQKQSVYKLVL